MMKKHEASHTENFLNIILGTHETSYGNRGNTKINTKLVGWSQHIQLKENDTVGGKIFGPINPHT